MLEVLDPDRDRAGEKYEAIRRKLLRFFEWRHAPDPEDLADDVIDRVGRRLAEGEHIQAADASAYFLGVARNVLRESWARRPAPEPLTEEDAARLAGDPQADDEESARQEAWASCLERCLERLPVESQELVLLYHQDQQRARIDGRRELARRLGIGLNALRIRIFRLRAVLEACVRACVSRPAAGK